MIELEQTVTLFNDSDKTAKQFANVDPEDKWIVVTHDGSTISLSIDNWMKLVVLASHAINGEESKSMLKE
ncbi:MAG: hypothetical protein WCJ72_13445 [Chryseobacterium sp.]